MFFNGWALSVATEKVMEKITTTAFSLATVALFFLYQFVCLPVLMIVTTDLPVNYYYSQTAKMRNHFMMHSLICSLSLSLSLVLYLI